MSVEVLNQMILDLLLLENSIYYFRTPRMTRFLKYYMRPYLVYRALRPLRSADWLPAIVREAAATFASIDAAENDIAAVKYQLRARYIHDIAHAIVFCCPNVQIVMKKEFTNSELSCIDHNLAIAIMIKRKDLVDKLLQRGANPWGHIEFEGPFAITLSTITHSTLDIVSTVIQSATENFGSLEKEERERIIADAITRAIQNNEYAALTIFGWYQSLADFEDRYTYPILFENCIRYGAASFMLNLLKKPTKAARRNEYRNSAIWAIDSDRMPDNILRICMVKRVLCPQKTYQLVNCHNEFRVTLIRVAVEREDVAMAETILSVSDRKYNGSSNTSNNFTFRKAVMSNNVNMVRLLLRHGFDPEGGHLQNEKSTFEIAREGSVVQHLIKTALLKRKEEFGERYIAPHRLVWNVKEQRDDLVRYSLSPRLG
jgi:hypothetical protein